MNKENKENLIPVKGLSPFKRFCMTIGELPASYLETMTYYEMLVWFTKYMQDTVIPTINNNASAVDELQDKYIEFTDTITTQQNNYEEHITGLFNELQTFVNNYFDNLDVQEEINNKLDQMAEDGILQEIISSYLNSKAIFGFDNVAQMKEATNLINGSFARTLGYYTKNDGGTGLYKIRTKSIDDIIDNGSLIQLEDNTLVAELIPLNNINFKQFGAKNDDDSSNNIQNAINYAIDNNITINDKTNCLFNTPITINSNVTNKLNFILNGEYTYTGTSYAFIFNNLNYSNITINSIVSNNGYGVEINTLYNDNLYTSTTHNNFNFNTIKSKYTNLKTYSERSMQYNKYYFSLLQSETCNIEIGIENPNTHNAWNNENQFYGGKLSDYNNSIPEYNVKVIGDGNNAHLNNNVFYNIGLEGTNKGVLLNNVSGIKIINPRTRELPTSSFIVLKNNVNNCYFLLNNFDIKFLNFEELTSGSGNIITGDFKGHTGQRIRFDNFILTCENSIIRMINCDQKSILYNGVFANTKEFSLDNENFLNGFPNYFRLGGGTIKLDTSFYNSDNINILYVDLRVDSASTGVAKITDLNNNTLVDLTSYTSWKKLKVTIFPKLNSSDITEDFKTEEITYI